MQTTAKKQNNNKNKETKTKKKLQIKTKTFVTSQKKHCFNLEKIHRRKTHCSVGLGTEKWKKKNKSQSIKRLQFLFPLVRSRQNSMADVS